MTDEVQMFYRCPGCGARWGTQWSAAYAARCNPKFLDGCPECDLDDDVLPEGMTATWAEMRRLVWDKTGGECWYCKAELCPFTNYEVDHVIPKIRGGRDVYENLVPACKNCNRSKGAKEITEWQNK